MAAAVLVAGAVIFLCGALYFFLVSISAALPPAALIVGLTGLILAGLIILVARWHRNAAGRAERTTRPMPRILDPLPLRSCIIMPELARGGSCLRRLSRRRSFTSHIDGCGIERGLDVGDVELLDHLDAGAAVFGDLVDIGALHQAQAYVHVPQAVSGAPVAVTRTVIERPPRLQRRSTKQGGCCGRSVVGPLIFYQF